MEQELRVCRLEGCEETFLAKVHNQAFCTKEHCKTYTNARILAQYHARKNRVTKGRICKDKKCDTILSKYNEGLLCAQHEHAVNQARWRADGWEHDPI